MLQRLLVVYGINVDFTIVFAVRVGLRGMHALLEHRLSDSC